MNLFRALPFILIAACGSSETPSGVGFGDAGSRSETVTVGQSYSRGSKNPAPGLYRTPTGAPWYVVVSRSVRNGGAKLQGFQALDTARRYNSPNWSPPYAKGVSTPSGAGMYRLVTVDGISFVVVRKIDTKSFWSEPKSELNGIADGAIRAVGCTRAGETFVQVASYTTQSITTPVNCSWL